MFISYLPLFLRYHQQNIRDIGLLGQPQQKGASDRTRRHNNLWIWGEDHANIDSEEQVLSVNSYQNVTFDFRWTRLTLEVVLDDGQQKTYVIGKEGLPDMVKNHTTFCFFSLVRYKFVW